MIQSLAANNIQPTSEAFQNETHLVLQGVSVWYSSRPLATNEWTEPD